MLSFSSIDMLWNSTNLVLVKYIWYLINLVSKNSTQNNLSTQKETKEVPLNVHNMSISRFLHKLLHHQAGNSTFNADCVNGHLLKLLVLHTYKKEVQCFAVVKHWFLQVAFLGKEKTMHGSSKLAKSLKQVQVINVMQRRQTHGS